MKHYNDYHSQLAQDRWFIKMCVKVLMTTLQKTPSIINRTTLLSLNSFIARANKSELLKTKIQYHQYSKLLEIYS